MIRPTTQERYDFAQNCDPRIRAAGKAMHDRCIECGIKPPFKADDLAWIDLADCVIRVYGAANAPLFIVPRGGLVDYDPGPGYVTYRDEADALVT